jgi:hypothetical protein
MNEYEFKAYCEEIRKDNKITDYVKDIGLNLVDKGGRIWISCPFHNEKTPSCTINTDGATEFFHCFGCGKSGSIIDFYVNYNNVTVGEAIKSLGSGIDIEYDVERIFKEYEEDIDESDQEKIMMANVFISKTCFNYLREIKPLVDKDVYDQEFEKINIFYEKLDGFIKDSDLDAVLKMENKICESNFIIDKVKDFEEMNKDED